MFGQEKYAMADVRGTNYRSQTSGWVRYRFAVSMFGAVCGQLVVDHAHTV
jgi:hypothetical protein